MFLSKKFISLEGLKVDRVVWLLEDGARRPPSYLKYALFVLLEVCSLSFSEVCSVYLAGVAARYLLLFSL